MMNLLSKVATKATLKIVGIAVTSAAAGFIAGVLTSKSKLDEVKKEFSSHIGKSEVEKQEAIKERNEALDKNNKLNSELEKLKKESKKETATEKKEKEAAKTETSKK